MIQQHCVIRKPWTLAFIAEPEEVASLRRILRLHLKCWGLRHLIETAELCVTELATNVIQHVGVGTPIELALSMKGTYLRMEMQDPDMRVLPTLLHASADAESGRGMAIVDAVTDRWGVLLKAQSKVIWCELDAGLGTPGGHVADAAVDRVEALLSQYGQVRLPHTLDGKPAAIQLIADLLGWAHAHGHDPDEMLESAETRFEDAAGHNL